MWVDERNASGMYDPAKRREAILVSVETRSLVFGLAVAAYALLGASAVGHARGQWLRGVGISAFVIVSLHIVGVWWHRYDFELAQATRNGYGGFVLFHGAYIAMLVAAFAPIPVSRWCTYAAFVAVSAGAVSAVFRYEFVELFRYPVLAVAILTPAFSGWSIWRRRTA
jgi:hypothetical protein